MVRWRVAALGMFLVFAAGSVRAAEVFGTISEDGKPVPKGVALKLECGDASGAGATDQFGSYTLKAAGSGACVLTVQYKGAAPSLRVTLYEKASRYDLVIRSESGKLVLARK